MSSLNKRNKEEEENSPSTNDNDDDNNNNNNNDDTIQNELVTTELADGVELEEAIPF
jgi:hypothetical protein